jgi:hypothetical protein
MIRKLASVGKDKDGWKKADEHLTTLMEQEHMITLEDTEAAIKRCEQHLQRAATDDASPKAKVLATEISGQDTAAELAALKATTKAQDAKIKALSAQLRGDTSSAKRARNGVPVSQLKRNLSTPTFFANNDLQSHGLGKRTRSRNQHEI